MDLKTAVYIMQQQLNQFSSLINELLAQSGETMALINMENYDNSIASVKAQIHAFTASMSIVMSASGSQSVIVQQSIDKVAELSAEP